MLYVLATVAAAAAPLSPILAAAIVRPGGDNKDDESDGELSPAESVGKKRKGRGRSGNQPLQVLFLRVKCVFFFFFFPCFVNMGRGHA
jgi:hypothetical protein